MKIPEIIYSSGNNLRFTRIAEKHGISIGCQLPATCYAQNLRFADLDFKKPNREKYMAALAKWRPYKAVVLDLMRAEMLGEVLDWAAEAAQHVVEVIVVPKVSGIIDEIPCEIGGKPILLGYAVWNSYALVPPPPLWEFEGRRIHLLGGSIQKQMKLAKQMKTVVSADGSYASMIARWGRAFRDGREIKCNHSGRDFPYRCFEETCRTLKAEWEAAMNGGGDDRQFDLFS